MDQAGLFDRDDRPTARERWEQFHAENPEVWRTFERLALEAYRAMRARRGRRSSLLGARLVWERMRWHDLTERPSDVTPWKLNDHYPPFYARLFHERHPELGQVFELRRIRPDRPAVA